MLIRWFMNIRVFLVWLLGFAFAMVILILWHELLMSFVVNTLLWSENITQLIHVLYYCLTGLLWVVFFVLSLTYLNRSAQKGRLLRGALLIFGIQLLLTGLAQAGLTLYRYFPADWPGILLILVEGLLGAGMLFFARRLSYHSLAAKDQEKRAETRMSQML